MFLHAHFRVKTESKVPGRIRAGEFVRAKSNRIREGNGRRFHERRKGKEKSFCFVVVESELNSVIHIFLSSVHALSSLVRLVTSLRGADFWSCVSSAKS